MPVWVVTIAETQDEPETASFYVRAETGMEACQLVGHPDANAYSLGSYEPPEMADPTITKIPVPPHKP